MTPPIDEHLPEILQSLPPEDCPNYDDLTCDPDMCLEPITENEVTPVVPPEVQETAQETASLPQGPIGQGPISLFGSCEEACSPLTSVGESSCIDTSGEPELNASYLPTDDNRLAIERQMRSCDPEQRHAGTLSSTHRVNEDIESACINPETADDQSCQMALEELEGIRKLNPDFFTSDDGKRTAELLVAVIAENPNAAIKQASAIILDRIDPQQAESAVQALPPESGLDYSEIHAAAQTDDPLFATLPIDKNNPVSGDETALNGTIDPSTGGPVGGNTGDMAAESVTQGIPPDDLSSTSWYLPLSGIEDEGSNPVFIAAQAVTTFPSDSHILTPEAQALTHTLASAVTPLPGGVSIQDIPGVEIIATIPIPPPSEGSGVGSNNFLQTMASLLAEAPQGGLSGGREGTSLGTTAPLYIVYQAGSSDGERAPQLVILQGPPPPADLAEGSSDTLFQGGYNIRPESLGLKNSGVDLSLLGDVTPTGLEAPQAQICEWSAIACAGAMARSGYASSPLHLGLSDGTLARVLPPVDKHGGFLQDTGGEAGYDLAGQDEDGSRDDEYADDEDDDFPYDDGLELDLPA